MPIPKILAPFLPASEHCIDKKVSILSPSLPFSPLHYNNALNIKEDPVIEIFTVDEDASAKSDETIMEERDTPYIEELEPNEHNALVLHQNPTSFENCGHDIIIENTSMAMYQPAHATAGIDFSPPAEFLEEHMIEDLIDTELTAERTMQVEQTKQAERIQSEFIQSTLTEPIQDIFTSPRIDQEQTHFAMQSTFHKSDSDFKSKCMKMIRNAKGLVCKPESPKAVPNRASIPVKPVAPRPTLRPIDTSFVPIVKIEEACGTPIYLRHNTTTLKASSMEPTTPYKSPVKGTVAYDIKLLCEQSFFGRW